MKKIVSLLFIALFLAGCASQSGLSGNRYDEKDARRVQQIRTGTIEEVRNVTITSNSKAAGQVGGVVGGVTGAVLGNTMGKGRGNTWTTVLGGLLGAAAGSAVGNEIGTSNKEGLEIIIQLQNGDTIGIVQEADEDGKMLKAGDKVRVMDGTSSRVVKLSSELPREAPKEPAKAKSAK